MKCTTVMLTLLLTMMSYGIQAQSKDQGINEIKSIKELNWDLEETNQSATLTQHYQFKVQDLDSPQYITLIVQKERGKTRPKSIIIYYPVNHVFTEDITFTFFKVYLENGEFKIDNDKSGAIHLKTMECNATCKIELNEGYFINDKNEKVDVFQKFLDFNQILFIINNLNHRSKNVTIYNESFAAQYRQLR